jgi:hypothetical protein
MTPVNACLRGIGWSKVKVIPSGQHGPFLCRTMAECGLDHQDGPSVAPARITVIGSGRVPLPHDAARPRPVACLTRGRLQASTARWGRNNRYHSLSAHLASGLVGSAFGGPCTDTRNNSYYAGGGDLRGGAATNHQKEKSRGSLMTQPARRPKACRHLNRVAPAPQQSAMRIIVMKLKADHNVIGRARTVGMWFTTLWACYTLANCQAATASIL